MLISPRRNTRLIQTLLYQLPWTYRMGLIWLVSNLKLWASSIKRFLVYFFTRDKEDLRKEIYIKMARCKSVVQGE